MGPPPPVESGLGKRAAILLRWVTNHIIFGLGRQRSANPSGMTGPPLSFGYASPSIRASSRQRLTCGLA
jgi:hypothetical protein